MTQSVTPNYVEEEVKEKRPKDVSLIDSNQIIKKHNKRKLDSLYKSYDQYLKIGQRQFERQEYQKAKHSFLLAFSENKTIEIAHLLSNCFSKLEEFDYASKFFETNLPFFQSNGNYWGILALHHYLIDDDEGAAGASLNAIESFGVQVPEIWKMFVYSSKKLNRAKLIYDVCKKHLNNSNLNPYIIEGYITGCCSTNNYEEALSFIQSIGLDRSNISSFGEVSPTLSTMMAAIIEKTSDNLIEELSWNSLANKLNPESNTIKWNLSLSQLKNGFIAEGSKNYEARFHCDEFVSPIDKFSKPIWHKNVDKNSRILVWYEQGIGDQLRFLSCIQFFQKEFPNLIIEPIEKLVGIIKNSLPDLEVREPNFLDGYKNSKADFDYHVSFGTIYCYIIDKHKESFSNPHFSLMEKYLVPDKLRVKFWCDKLNRLSRKPKIGFCWRSSMISPERSREYSDISLWKDLLTSKNFSFVSLQYDLDYDDFKNSHPDFESYFLETGFLDQKDDLEGAASLISNLDFVISAGSSPSMISSGLGVPTIVFGAMSQDWFGRIKPFSSHPLYKNTFIYPSFNVPEDVTLVSDISNFLDNHF